MQKNQIRALIKLITTEDDFIATELKKELTDVIKTHPSTLRNVLDEEYGRGVPAFVNSLVEEVAWERFKTSFSRFAGKINPDLEEGLLLLSQFNNISVQKDFFNIKLDGTISETRKFIINCADAVDVAEALKFVFFDSLKIKTAAFTQIKHLSFDKFLDSKEGSGLCVASLYYLTGIRYGIDINIVDVAGRILLKFEENLLKSPFYADPFDKGKLLTQKDVMEFVFARGLDWKEEYSRPLTSRMIVKRFLSNMIFMHNKIKDERKLEFLREYLSYFER